MDAKVAGGISDFASKLQTLLEEGSTVQALTQFTDNRNNSEIVHNSWDLIPIVCNHLSEECEDKNVEVFKCCERLIDIIAQESKPEEALLQFIEEIETATDDTKFLMLIKPLMKVLLRVPEKRATSLVWCFNSIQMYLEKLETPENYDLTEEKRLLLDQDPLLSRIVFLHKEVVQFSEVFVNEVIKTDDPRSNKFNVVRKCLVQILAKPLACLDLEIYKETKPEARRIVEDLMKKIQKVTPDPFIFLEYNDGSYDADLVKPKDLSLGIFYYLILSENIYQGDYPKVYNPIYLFHKCLRYIVKLFIDGDSFILRKGLALATALLKRVSHSQLPYLLLDGEIHSRFCLALSDIIVHNESQDVRKQALLILESYMWSFEHQGRYNLIFNLIGSLSHSGLKGYIITQYKEMLRLEMTSNPGEKMSRYYKGIKLFDLLERFTYLRRKEESDLVDESDQIVSALNLFRFLLIADKTGETLIDYYLDKAKAEYFNVVDKGIRLSKAHYELRLKELKDGKNVDEDGDKTKFNVTVSGQNLLEMPTDKQIEILNLSVTTLDVIESLLFRVLACVEVRSSN